MPIVARSRKRLARTGKVDWNRVDATTDDALARQIAEDPETAPEVTEEALDRSVVVSPNGTRTPYRPRVRERHALECLAPGTKAPESGQYEIIGPRGGRTGEERTVVKGDPLPPTPASGQRYRPVGSSRRRHGI
jgi:hypothetical protein